MIYYCEAEELNQVDHLESLIRVKFKKKLHVVEWDDDDDDGGSKISPPVKALT